MFVKHWVGLWVVGHWAIGVRNSKLETCHIMSHTHVTSSQVGPTDLALSLGSGFSLCSTGVPGRDLSTKRPASDNQTRPPASLCSTGLPASDNNTTGPPASGASAGAPATHALLWLVCRSPFDKREGNPRINPAKMPGLERLSKSQLAVLESDLLASKLPQLQLFGRPSMHQKFADTIAGLALLKLPTRTSWDMGKCGLADMPGQWAMVST